MDATEIAPDFMAAMEDAENQGREDDRTRDRTGESFCLGLQWPGGVVERRSVTYERYGDCQMAGTTGTHEPSCGASTFYQPCMNRRMPNGHVRWCERQGPEGPRLLDFF